MLMDNMGQYTHTEQILNIMNMSRKNRHLSPPNSVLRKLR